MSDAKDFELYALARERIEELESEVATWKRRATERLQSREPVLTKICDIMGWTYHGSHVMQAQDSRKQRDEARTEIARLRTGINAGLRVLGEHPNSSGILAAVLILNRLLDGREHSETPEGR